jgi:hypothetical protein
MLNKPNMVCRNNKNYVTSKIHIKTYKIEYRNKEGI